MSYFEGHDHVCPTETMSHWYLWGLQVEKLVFFYLCTIQLFKYSLSAILFYKPIRTTILNPKLWKSLLRPLLLHQERKLITVSLSPRVIAALSGFIHKEAAAPAENVRECEGTKWSKYKRRSQNTSPSPLFIVQIYLGDRDKVVSCRGSADL